MPLPGSVVTGAWYGLPNYVLKAQPQAITGTTIQCPCPTVLRARDSICSRQPTYDP
jgi:hypothetical protein